jgi:Protein of unknown function (DUF664)
MTAQSHTCNTRTLLPWLAAQQRRVRGILDGLDDRTLRQPVLPSGWSCAGMVQHLTLTTRFWFVEVMAGHRTGPPEDDDFHVSDIARSAAVDGTCHAGHLDAARELIDGRTWDYARERLSDPQ